MYYLTKDMNDSKLIVNLAGVQSVLSDHDGSLMLTYFDNTIDSVEIQDSIENVFRALNDQKTL